MMNPSLRRIHSDRILESGSNRFALEYWRKQPTDNIMQSLRPGNPEALKVKPDGRIMDGNVRIKVLEERGFDINNLPREGLPYKDGGLIMNVSQVKEIFCKYSLQEQIDFVVRFAHALTVLARDTYEVGEDGLTNPFRLRIINEIQHRVTSFLMALMKNDEKRYPEDVFLRIILEHSEDLELQRQLQETFDHFMAEMITTPSLYANGNSID